jgi:hypothetical protein
VRRGWDETTDLTLEFGAELTVELRRCRSACGGEEQKPSTLVRMLVAASEKITHYPFSRVWIRHTDRELDDLIPLVA